MKSVMVAVVAVAVLGACGPGTTTPGAGTQNGGLLGGQGSGQGSSPGQVPPDKGGGQPGKCWGGIPAVAEDVNGGAANDLPLLDAGTYFPPGDCFPGKDDGNVSSGGGAVGNTPEACAKAEDALLLCKTTGLGDCTKELQLYAVCGSGPQQIPPDEGGNDCLALKALYAQCITTVVSNTTVCDQILDAVAQCAPGSSVPPTGGK